MHAERNELPSDRGRPTRFFPLCLMFAVCGCASTPSTPMAPPSGEPSRIEALLLEVERLEGQRAQLEAVLAESAARNADLERRWTGLRVELEELEGELARRDERLAAALTELGSWKRRFAELSQEGVREKALLEGNLAALREENAELSDRLEQARQAAARPHWLTQPAAAVSSVEVVEQGSGKGHLVVGSVCLGTYEVEGGGEITEGGKATAELRFLPFTSVFDAVPGSSTVEWFLHAAMKSTPGDEVDVKPDGEISMKIFPRSSSAPIVKSWNILAREGFQGARLHLEGKLGFQPPGGGIELADDPTFTETIEVDHKTTREVVGEWLRELTQASNALTGLLGAVAGFLGGRRLKS